MLQPFILQGNLILQSAWTYKWAQEKSLNWGDKFPEEISNRWLKWIKDIKNVPEFTTNRYIYLRDLTRHLNQKTYIFIAILMQENWPGEQQSI